MCLTKEVETVKTRLPYNRIRKQYDCVSHEALSGVLRESLDSSRDRPAYLEVTGGGQHCFAFFRNGQIYGAGTLRNGQFAETTIKEFILAATRAEPARVTCYEVDSKILHSLLILFQKKPALKLLTSLVDLDQVLDKIEEEGKSCIVAAGQDEFFAILRYEKGRVTAFCHEQTSPAPRERSFREEFLVKIYTLSAEHPLTISVYEDLLVRYASDARVIDAAYKGSIVDLFASKPPVLTLLFKDKEIGHWALDKPLFRIGRTPDNDIVIDNLAVSRIHSVIEDDKGGYYIRDCDSLNGTIVNGRRVGRALLKNADEMQIGKHKLVFQTSGSKPISPGPAPDGFDQTVIMHADKRLASHPYPATRTDTPAGAAPVAVGEHEPAMARPRLVQRLDDDERVFEIGESSLTMGKDEKADVAIGGFLVAARHAEITREDGRYVIRHLSGMRRVTVDGEPVKERILKNNDRIRIAKKEFVFEE